MLNWIRNYFRKPKAGETWVGKYSKVKTKIYFVSGEVVWHTREDRCDTDTVTGTGTGTGTYINEFKGLYAKLD